MLSAIKKRIKRAAIDHQLLNSAQITINGKNIEFHNISSSNLLKEVAINGLKGYEPELVKFMESYPFEIKTFIDGGSNVGFYTVIACTNFGENVEVIAVEPFPENAKYIRHVQQANNLNFTLIEKALHSEADQEIEMHYPVAKNSSKLSSSASVINSFEGTQGLYSNLPSESLTVTTTTLEDVVSQQEFPALIKLDCEGNELTILEKSKDLLKRDDVDFIIEIMINDKDKKEIFDLMKSNGFGSYLITNAGLVQEDRPLTLPYHDKDNRTCWKNHFFTKRPIKDIETFSKDSYKYWI